MPETLLSVGHGADTTAEVDVEIVVPVFNEAATLESSIRELHAYLSTRFPLRWQVTIADNASTDGTWEVACALATELPGVVAAHVDRKGRGLALRSTWLASRAAVVAYMDVDLSTDLDALLPLVAPLVTGHSDVAIGSRLARGARVVRGPKREVISRAYNLVLKAALRNRFSDAQCGFKAMRADVARELLPLVEDDGWFFDTEVLVLAEHNGLRIHEVPVDWVDDPDSRVDIVQTALDDLRGVWRLLRALAAGRGVLPDASPPPAQLARFALVGAATTVLFAALFLALAPAAGVVVADVVALALSAVVNTALNRRVTFGVRGRARRRTHYVRGTAVSFLPLGLTLLALALVHGSLLSSFVAVTVANALATLVRFVLLRRIVV